MLDLRHGWQFLEDLLKCISRIVCVLLLCVMSSKLPTTAKKRTNDRKTQRFCCTERELGEASRGGLKG